VALLKHKCFESAVFARLLFLNKQLFPTVFSQGFQGLDIFFEDRCKIKGVSDAFFILGSLLEKSVADPFDSSVGEYARDTVHTNTIEGYFSLLKRGLIETFQHVGSQHLKRYMIDIMY